MATPLEGCVSSLRSSLALLDSSISILSTGVNDFPRLSKVLQTTRHFELTSESSLHHAQSSLQSELKPEVDALLQRVSSHLDRLERREANLMARYDLQAGRLNQDATMPARGSTMRVGNDADDGDGGEARAKAGGRQSARNPLEELKMRHLRQKRERLSYAVERLTLQAQQRERQLRMSMAAPQRVVDEPDFGDFD